jgi:tetratricopeptide (TPR) repeat protein
VNTISKIDILADAFALHRQGNLRAARQRYQDILRDEPDNADALYYVAVIAAQEKDYQQGIEFAQRALAVSANKARVQNLLGQIHLRSGNAAEALACFNQVLSQQPDYIDAYGIRADILADLGRFDEALANYDRALEERPDSAEDWHNRATILPNLNRAEEALANFDRAIALRPNFADAHFNRANILRSLGRMGEALEGYHRATVLRPTFMEAHMNYALALSYFDRHEEALVSIDRALELRPDDFDAIVNRGNILRNLGELDRAEEEYQRALRINPNSSAPYLGRANVLLERGLYQEARATAEHASALAPDSPEPLYTIAYLQLMAGEWEQGWKFYEVRNQTIRPAYHALPFRQWNGEPLHGEGLVVLTEGGMGDEIHFSRFARVLAERGYDVTVLASKPLGLLLSSLGQVRIVTSTEELLRDARPLRWIPIMSLPRLMDLRPTNIPARVPYLSAERARVQAWAERLGSHGFKIGICWKSGPLGDRMNRKRDIPLAAFAPLAEIPGVRLITLQLGRGLDQIAQVAFRDRIERTDDALLDWSDTAALMMNLDLVVTCDTSVPHLAGALARPTFIALPPVACWRWLLDREDSPWYPTIRLFRRTPNEDWIGALGRIAEATRALIATSATQ